MTVSDCWQSLDPTYKYLLTSLDQNFCFTVEEVISSLNSTEDYKIKYKHK